MGNYKHAPGSQILESAVEHKLDVLVRKILKGRTIKLAPVDAGIPDRLVILPWNRFYFVELKAKGGKVSPIQAVWHQRIERLGPQVAVLFDVEGVETWVAETYDEIYGG